MVSSAPMTAEIAPLEKLSKMIVAKEVIPAGTMLTEEHFDYRSPGHGVPPAQFHLLVEEGGARH